MSYRKRQGSWNKGLTKETDDRVAEIARKSGLKHRGIGGKE